MYVRAMCREVVGNFWANPRKTRGEPGGRWHDSQHQVLRADVQVMSFLHLLSFAQTTRAAV